MTLLAALALATGLAESAPPRISDSIVQIGVIPKATTLTFRLHGGFQVIDQKTGESHDLDRGQAYHVEAGRGALHFGPFLFLGQVRLIPKSAEDYLEVGSGRFHGSLLVKPNKDATMTVIQETGIEEYLYGVLGKEMGADWPAEALKAQAVVARTFTLSNLGKFAGSGFDLSVDQRSQVYGDLDGRDPKTTAAVEATGGEVLYHKGRVLKAFFHACCGGATSSVGAIWGDSEKAERPSRGVKDRWCKISPHMKWRAYFAFDDILNALNRNGRMVMKLKSLGRGKEDASGRLKTIRFHTDAGSFDVRADHFRNWMGSAELKSTYISRITRRSRGYELHGRGFGHGAGLCQWGARGMAQKGKSYRQILEHYFPGAEVRKRDD